MNKFKMHVFLLIIALLSLNLPSPTDRLSLQIAASKNVHRFSEKKLDISVRLTNTGTTDIFVDKSLNEGSGGNLRIIILNQKGQEVESFGIADHIYVAGEPSGNRIAKLRPREMLSSKVSIVFEALRSFKAPGLYKIFAIYRSSTSRSDVEASPFWGVERAPLKSNIIAIRIIPMNVPSEISKLKLAIAHTTQRRLLAALTQHKPPDFGEQSREREDLKTGGGTACDCC